MSETRFLSPAKAPRDRRIPLKVAAVGLIFTTTLGAANECGAEGGNKGNGKKSTSSAPSPSSKAEIVCEGTSVEDSKNDPFTKILGVTAVLKGGAKPTNARFDFDDGSKPAKSDLQFEAAHGRKTGNVTGLRHTFPHRTKDVEYGVEITVHAIAPNGKKLQDKCNEQPVEADSPYTRV